MRHLSLKWKFSAFIAILLLGTVGILSALVLGGVSSYQREQLEQDMARRVQSATTRITQQYVTGTRVDAATFMQLQGQSLAMELGAASGLRVVLFDAEGRKAGDSLPLVEDTGEADLLGYALQNRIAYATEGDTLDYYAPLTGTDGQLGVIRYQASISDQRAFYRQIVLLLTFVGIGVAIISIALGLIYMNRQAAAIAKLKAATDRIRRGDYSADAGLRRRDELGELSHGIDAMRRAIHVSLEALGAEKSNMAAALARLQQLEQQQKQFIGNVSHELKTPLTTIKAYADLLGMYEDDPDLMQDARTTIAKEADRLHDLLEMVLKLAALEKYEFNHQPERVDLQALLRDVAERMKGRTDKLGIALHADLQPAIVWADRESLMHIFVNLLDNAIKYNRPNGSITIGCRIAGNSAEVECRDTGIGIPTKLRERIFEPFYTVNKDRARQSGGSGLGLALVKQLVEKQQGTIVVCEAPEGGSCFVIALPLFREPSCT